jgi:uncharacterized LabA/DUF88 family protein
MRSNCAVYVDAGYLLASAATRATGTSLRNSIHVEFQALIRSIVQQAEELSQLPLLRVHWYDSAKDGVPDSQQERIGEIPRVKLRLGRFGVDGQQKGVDLRIGLDLVTHARNSAADVFFLVSGDDDLTEAVEEAQVHGVQVIVLAVPGSNDRPHGVSRHLVRAADEIAMMSPAAIDGAVMRIERPLQVVQPEPAPAAAPGSPPRATPNDVAALHRSHQPQVGPVVAYSSSTSSGGAEVAVGYEPPESYDVEIDAVVTRVLKTFLLSATPQDLADLARSRPSIPRDIDRALLTDLSESLGVYDLPDPVRFRLRDRFWETHEEQS